MKKHIVKEYFTDALFELMQTKSLGEISINELVAKSGASRASFYRNYTSKEQILEEYLTDTFSSIFAHGQSSAGGITDEVRMIFEDIRSQRGKLAILRKAGLLNRIDPYIYEHTMLQLTKYGMLNEKYEPFFFAGAAAAIIKAWIEFDFEESPDEISCIFFKCLAGALRVK